MGSNDKDKITSNPSSLKIKSTTTNNNNLPQKNVEKKNTIEKESYKDFSEFGQSKNENTEKINSNSNWIDWTKTPNFSGFDDRKSLNSISTQPIQEEKNKSPDNISFYHKKPLNSISSKPVEGKSEIAFDNNYNPFEDKNKTKTNIAPIKYLVEEKTLASFDFTINSKNPFDTEFSKNNQKNLVKFDIKSNSPSKNTIQTKKVEDLLDFEELNIKTEVKEVKPNENMWVKSDDLCKNIFFFYECKEHI